MWMNMISHELNLSKLPDNILKRNGFKRIAKNKDRHTHYLNISPSYALLYDAYGFLTWKRRDTANAGLKYAILIPEQIRTERALKGVINRLTRKYA